MPRGSPRCFELLGTTKSVTKLVNEAPDEAALVSYGLAPAKMPPKGAPRRRDSKSRSVSRGPMTRSGSTSSATRPPIRTSSMRDRSARLWCSHCRDWFTTSSPRPICATDTFSTWTPSRSRQWSSRAGKNGQRRRIPLCEEQGWGVGHPIAADARLVHAGSRQTHRLPGTTQ